MKELKCKTTKRIGYIFVLIISILISGCNARETSVTSAPAISSSEGAVIATDQKEETGKAEWLSEKITPIKASDWEKAVDENKRYLFILEGEKTIVQIDKKTKKSTPVVQCKKKDTIYFLIAEEDNLYYQLNDNAIYQYNLSTGKEKQIYHTEKEPDSIFGMQVYKNDIYLYRCGLIISKLDQKTEKQEKLLENVSNPIFIDNKLFFMKHRDVTTIYCLDLNTGKKETVRKLKNKMRFGNLFQYKGKLCYTVFGDQDQICMMSERGKNTVLVKEQPKQVLYPVYSREKDTLYYICEEDTKTKGDVVYLGIYKKGKNRKIQLPEDYDERGCVCNGYFFYTGWIQNDEGEEEKEYYCAYVNIKDEQLKEK